MFKHFFVYMDKYMLLTLKFFLPKHLLSSANRLMTLITQCQKFIFHNKLINLLNLKSTD